MDRSIYKTLTNSASLLTLGRITGKITVNKSLIRKPAEIEGEITLIDPKSLKNDDFPIDKGNYYRYFTAKKRATENNRNYSPYFLARPEPWLIHKLK